MSTDMSAGMSADRGDLDINTDKDIDIIMDTGIDTFTVFEQSV
jgi:hypothetical protein